MANNVDTFEVTGEIEETLPNMMFRVHITAGPEDLIGKTVLATIAGKMKMYRIKVMLGDVVRVAVSKYDTARGRITFRERT